MSLDVRKEQLSLLKFEKKVAGLAAVLAAGSATAASASDKLGGEEAAEAYAAIQQALVNLADVTSAAHAVLEERVVTEGLRALEFSARVPKMPLESSVRSILGLG